MTKQNSQDYTFNMECPGTAKEIFDAILNVRGWWSGLYSEEIEGSSANLNDEFAFSAGNGAHYSKQKLIELVPESKVVWLVTDSNLTFLEKPNEWNGTKISFEISIPDNNGQDTKIHVRFSHQGLVPDIECYNGCSSAWSRYMQQLQLNLNNKQ